jgi:hypothetical protein
MIKVELFWLGVWHFHNVAGHVTASSFCHLVMLTVHMKHHSFVTTCASTFTIALSCKLSPLGENEAESLVAT